VSGTVSGAVIQGDKIVGNLTFGADGALRTAGVGDTPADLRSSEVLEALAAADADADADCVAGLRQAIQIVRDLADGQG